MRDCRAQSTARATCPLVSVHQHDRPLDRRAAACGVLGDSTASDSASVSVRTITASGFSSRRLRARRRTTACSEVASQARWKPPMPFTATIRPDRRAAAACGDRIGDSQRSSAVRCEPHAVSTGPHCGQAFGCAWNRRSRTVVVLAAAAGRTSRTAPSSSSRGRRARRWRW